MKIWHCTFGSQGRFPLFRDDADRLEAIRRIVRIAGKEMALFSLVDEHAHLLIVGTRERTRRLRQAIRQSLEPLTDSPIVSSWVEPVVDRKHMFRQIRYFFLQVIHHEVLDAQPALWHGSCFLDLVEARYIEGLELQIEVIIPRKTAKGVACSAVGLPGTGVDPLGRAAVREMGSRRIVEASFAAVASTPNLKGQSRIACLARRVAAHMGHIVGLAKEEMIWVLGVKRQSFNAMLREPVSRQMLKVVARRLALEVAVAALPPPKKQHAA